MSGGYGGPLRPRRLPIENNQSKPVNGLTPHDDLLKFYEEYAVNTFARKGQDDPYLVPTGQHIRDGFAVHRYTSGTHWFCEDGVVSTLKGFFGNEVIYFKNQPIWAHQYEGEISYPDFQTHEKEAELHAFLRSAFQVREVPFQPHGPQMFEHRKWLYFSSLEGDITNFFGDERIFHCDISSDVPVYFSRFSGRLIV